MRRCVRLRHRRLNERNTRVKGVQLVLGLVNRDIIFSIKPKYAEQIMTGVKTVELRRRFRNEANVGARAFIYSSTPTKAMVGYATIADVRRLSVHEIWAEYAGRAGITREDFDAYFSGLDQGYVIALTDAHRFTTSVAIGSLRKRFGFRAPQSYRYAGTEYRALIG
jgi:predicted transcriptional regulator